MLISGYGLLTGLGAAALAPWMFERLLIPGGVAALVCGGALSLVCGLELRRLVSGLRGREAVGKARVERLEAMERALAALPPEERGPMLAGAIEEILDERERHG